MNFFAEQDQARRNTKKLVALYVLAVFILIMITNVILAVGFWVVDGQLSTGNAAEVLLNDARKPVSSYFTAANFGKISLFVCGSIALVILFKWIQLGRGGRGIAEALGGTRIHPNTDDRGEQRLLNVVEEMALASGMPVPAVYILQGEKGINAFAAGTTPSNAVIGVTKGALEHFDRDQLQGVIAHEFSHIFNGDMRLNLRLIALLSGIVFISNAGEIIMRAGGGGWGRRTFTGSRRSSDARIVLIGLAIMIVGWLGCFFAGMIKAAISRQREFLADASAVQFTRNPDGIGDALRIIGGYSAGSTVFSQSASEASHMFISEAVNEFSGFDTHPPIDERIERILPNWDGEFIERAIIVTPPPAENKSPEQKMAMAGAVVAGAVLSGGALQATGTESVGSDDDKEQGLPIQLKENARDPFGAAAIIYGLLLGSDEKVRTKQLDFIQATNIKGLAIYALQLLPALQALDKHHRLELIELCMPALKTFSKPQYLAFKKALLLLIRADHQYELFEWCLYQLVRHYLSGEFEDERPSRSIHSKVADVKESFVTVLSLLVQHGHQDDANQAKQRAFERACESIGLSNAELIDKDQSDLDSFIKAVNQLANCYPLLKPKILKALVQAAQTDGKIATEEQEIIVAVAAVMDCPVPDLSDAIK